MVVNFERAFDLSGGLPCLDFVNEAPSLETYDDLLALAARTELISRDEALALAAEATRRPHAAASLFDRARAVRDELHEALMHMVDEREGAPTPLPALNAELA